MSSTHSAAASLARPAAVPSAAPIRRSRPTSARPRRHHAGPRPRSPLFLPPAAQQVTSAFFARIPVGDLLAAAAMLTAIGLWGIVLHLLA